MDLVRSVVKRRSENPSNLSNLAGQVVEKISQMVGAYSNRLFRFRARMDEARILKEWLRKPEGEPLREMLMCLADGRIAHVLARFSLIARSIPALVLVGWYLMVPPVNHPWTRDIWHWLDSRIAITDKCNPDASLSEWKQEGEFERASGCQAQQEKEPDDTKKLRNLSMIGKVAHLRRQCETWKRKILDVPTMLDASQRTIHASREIRSPIAPPLRGYPRRFRSTIHPRVMLWCCL
jgi:hypothetical protein